MVSVVSSETCKEIYSKFHRAVFEENICAGWPNGDGGQCFGDSGGSLTINGTLYGIVSWGPRNCVKKPKPTVYVKISHYVDWIKKTIEKHD